MENLVLFFSLNIMNYTSKENTFAEVSFLMKSLTEGLQLYQKGTPAQVFFVDFSQFLRTHISYDTRKWLPPKLRALIRRNYSWFAWLNCFNK